MSSSDEGKVEKALSQKVWDSIGATKLSFPPNKEERKLYGDAFIEDWQELFSQHVWNTPHYDRLILHAILGQLPAIKNMRMKVRGTILDPRIHVCLFQDSGSGKGRGFNFAADVSACLNLIYQPLTEITDAALIGTIETSTEYVPKKGTETIREVKNGWLHEDSGINIFAMNEAEVLFTSKSSQYAKNAMTYFQIAMNTLGTPDSWIVKKLSTGDAIVCKPAGSFLLTSYLPENLYDTIVRRGFLQRMIVVVNKITTQQRYDNAVHSIDGLMEDDVAKHTMDDLAQRLRIINRWYTTQKTFKISPGAKELFKVVLDDLFAPLYDISVYQRSKLEEFVHRWLEIIYKLAFHHMVLRLDATIKPEDVAYAKNFLVPIWMGLTSFLEDSLIEPGGEKSKRMVEAMQAIEAYDKLVEDKYKNQWVPEPVLRTMLARLWNVQQRTASDRVARLTYEEDYFKTKNQGMTPYLKLKKRLKT